MMSASAIICVCCSLSFADTATDSQDGKETQKEEQVQQDEQQLEETNAVKDEQKQTEAPDAAQQEKTDAKDDAQTSVDTATEGETKTDAAPAKNAPVQKAAPAPAFRDPQIANAFREFNNFRIRNGLKPCEFNPNLQMIAQRHSNNMNHYRRMYHSGTPYVAENVYMGSYSGVHAVRVWMNSPGHRANMLGPYRRVGIARTGNFFTMILQ